MSSLMCALALMLAPAISGPAQQNTRSAEAAQLSQETASELARTVAPADLMIPLEVDQARKGILLLPTVDASSKELEADYPGIFAAVWAAAEPEVRRSITDSYPKFWTALEQLYRSRLSQDEAQAILSFYRSETGQRLLRGMLNGIDASPLVADIAKSPDAPVTAEQMKTLTDAAKADAIKQLKPGDSVALLWLMHFVDLEKFKTLGADTQKLTVEWVNQEDPEGDAKLEAVMEKAMKQYMADHPK